MGGEDYNSMLDWYKKAKIITVAVLALLAIIVVLQNTEAVETKILFISFTMPRAAMLFGALLIGFALGVLAAGHIANRSKKKPP